MAASSETMQARTSSGLTLGDLYSKCVQMVNENKVSTKNAFDIKLIEHMDDIVSSFMGGGKKSRPSGQNGARMSKVEEQELRFHEASCTIEASARIYACRVDCVHTDTYRVLGGLSSTADAAEDGDGAGDGKPGAAKKRRICGVNTLERNEANIIQQNLDADEESDPMFRRMAAAFDAGGAQGLLLAHLPVAEDLSLIFNGDVPMNRAASVAKDVFVTPSSLRSDELGLGPQPPRFKGLQLCPGLDTFRKQLWVGNSKCLEVTLPPAFEALFGDEGTAGQANGGGQASAALVAAGDVKPSLAADGMDIDDTMPMPPTTDGGLATPLAADEDVGGELPAMPDAEVPTAATAPPPAGDPSSSSSSTAIVAARSGGNEIISFDELFAKFCGSGSGGSNQFAYFDECWAKINKDGRSVGGGVLMDKDSPAKEGKEKKGSKKAVFDLASLTKPARPIEHEPASKHQLSERAALWQLRKDVPPYMIDRITMPNWPTWSKSDFACLGLRPHLMLKLQRKPQPPGDGPHNFSDLFSTIVVENPQAFPWSVPNRASMGRDRGVDPGDRDGGGLGRDADLAEDNEDIDANGLPAHLDIDPQDLFLAPEDKVVPGFHGDDETSQNGGAGPGDDLAFDGGFNPPDIDFDLVERPQQVGNVDISYSRNSKFVDVKLVKRHLLDCISEEASSKQAARQNKIASSFQGLVSKTVDRMPRAECQNLSVAVCFICALHLCNEKGLELEPGSTPLGDFKVVGVPS